MFTVSSATLAVSIGNRFGQQGVKAPRRQGFEAARQQPITLRQPRPNPIILMSLLILVCIASPELHPHNSQSQVASITLHYKDSLTRTTSPEQTNERQGTSALPGYPARPQSPLEAALPQYDGTQSMSIL